MEDLVLDYEFYTEGGAHRFRELSHNGLVTAFLYSDRIYTNGEGKPLEENGKSARIIAKGGVMYAPISLFAEYFAVNAEISIDTVTLTLGDNKVECETFKDRDILYINPLTVANTLGIPVSLFYEDMLLALGNKEAISLLKGDSEAINAGAYITLGEYNPYAFVTEDYKRARARWCESVVGSPEYNDLSNPAIKEKCEIASRECKKWWESMNRGEDRVILWGDAPPTESRQLGEQYYHLLIMARAYGTYGSDYYHDEELRLDIVEGVRWMYENMYGEKETEGRGWRDPHKYNWWDWYIPSPTYLTEILFILEDSFTLEERRKYLYFFEWYARTYKTASGMSRVGVFTQVALAIEKPEYLMRAFMDFDILLTKHETGHGPHFDFVHFSHRMPYNNAYGVMNLERVLRVYACLFGSGVEFKSPKLYNQFMFAKYMFEPAMRDGQAMVFMRGRQVAGSEYGTAGSITWQILRLYGLFGTDEDEYLATILRRQAKNPQCLNAIKTGSSIPICNLVAKLLRDNIEPPIYVYAHSWFTGDKAVQHRKHYAFALSMSSEREPAFESINSVNINGWHQGDGATYLYTGYDQNQYDGKNFQDKNRRIAYTFPGTTEDERERKEKSISYLDTYWSTNEFAGSMQIMDKYILGAMDFISYNVDTPDDPCEIVGEAGGRKPYHINDLVAKKAYFALDDIIVCLGAGINSTMSSPVNTTIEHRRIVNKQSDKLYVNGELLPNENLEKCYTGPAFALLEGHAGFETLDNSTLCLSRYTSVEAGEQDFFELKICHGENPKDGGYAYAIYPTPEYISASDNKRASFEIISNTSKLQAVKSNTLGFTSYVFYEAGECEIISTDMPSLVTIIEELDTITLMVCDPTHKRESGEFTLSLPLLLIEASEKLNATVKDGKTVITADFREAHGRTYSAKFKK